VLNLYPDVYDRDTNTVQAVREELAAVGADAFRLDDNTIEAMLGRVSESEKFAVEISDLVDGRGLAAGRTAPLAGDGRQQPLPRRRSRARQPANHQQHRPQVGLQIDGQVGGGTARREDQVPEDHPHGGRTTKTTDYWPPATGHGLVTARTRLL
jgi:hypothetical protein